MLFVRKTILVCALVLLSVVYVCQVLNGAKSPVKNFGLEKDFDKIIISSQEKGSFELKKNGEVWFVGEDEADENAVSELTEMIKELRCIGVVEKSTDDIANERFGLLENQKINVLVFAADKQLLSIEIGKDAAGGTQNYIRVNRSSEIYLAASGLREVFSVEKDSLKKTSEEKENPEILQ